MDMSEIQRLASGGESETVEFKRSTGQLTRAGETLCAFLNRQGGFVLFGVTSAGEVVGQEVSDSTLQSTAAMIRRLEPAVQISIERAPLENGREVLVLQAPASTGSIPFTFDGRPFQRIGTTTSTMPQEEYQRLLLARAHSHSRWENATALGVVIDDLDREEILRTVRLGIEAGRLPEATGTDIADILDRLQLRSEGRILNAAVVLFGTDLPLHYPQCHLRLARFRGTDKSEFLDNRQLHGHAFALLEEAMSFMLRHLPIAGRFEPGRLERIDEPLFPVAALREAVINALCHRTYEHAGGAVSIAIYDDRLEIWSDGTLPFGLTPEDLKRRHDSRPRNPLIAGVFYRRGLIEQWGRGTQKIVELCVQAGHPEPEFGEQAGSVWVNFLPSGYIAPHRVSHDLTERQREILEIIAQAGPTPLRNIMSRMSAPPAPGTVRDDIYHLKRLDLIDTQGHGVGAVWFLKR